MDHFPRCSGVIFSSIFQGPSHAGQQVTPRRLSDRLGWPNQWKHDQDQRCWHALVPHPWQQKKQINLQEKGRWSNINILLPCAIWTHQIIYAYIFVYGVCLFGVWCVCLLVWYVLSMFWWLSVGSFVTWFFHRNGELASRKWNFPRGRKGLQPNDKLTTQTVHLRNFGRCISRWFVKPLFASNDFWELTYQYPSCG